MTVVLTVGLVVKRCDTYSGQELPRLLPFVELKTDIPDVVVGGLDQLQDEVPHARIVTHGVDLHDILGDVFNGQIEHWGQVGRDLLWRRCGRPFGAGALAEASDLGSSSVRLLLRHCEF